MEQKTKLEIINETAEFYNSENRGFDGNSCQYFMDDGKKCAVGRCLLDVHLATIRERTFEGGVESLCARMKSDLDDLLKPEYRGHPPYFWCRLQDFHDGSANWDENGLTLKGRQMQESLIREFCI